MVHSPLMMGLVYQVSFRPFEMLIVCKYDPCLYYNLECNSEASIQDIQQFSGYRVAYTDAGFYKIIIKFDEPVLNNKTFKFQHLNV